MQLNVRGVTRGAQCNLIPCNAPSLFFLSDLLVKVVFPVKKERLIHGNFIDKQINVKSLGKINEQRTSSITSNVNE